jgi:hypothetical protein
MKIDKNVPIPEKHHRGNNKYPWDEMGVSDSFLADKIKHVSVSQGVSRVNKNKKPKHFICKKVENGTRVWRDK